MRAFRASLPDGRPFYVPSLERSIREEVVFYADSDPITGEEVRRALVDHDGYPPGIEVEEIA